MYYNMLNLLYWYVVMFFKYFSLVFTLLITSFSNLYAGKGDLYLAYDLPEVSKQRLYKDFVAGSVPYNKTAQDYHVTLTWVNKVAPQHRNLLKTRLELVANSHRPKVHFTPKAAVQLGKSLQSTIGLVPQDAEKKYFQKINSALYDEVINFNIQHNTFYDLSPLVLPQNYKPHATIARTKEDIQKHNLNPHQVMNTVNLKLDNYKNTYGMGLDLFQVVQPKLVAAIPLPQSKPAAKILLSQSKPAAKLLLSQSKPAAKISFPQSKPAPKRAALKKKPVFKAMPAPKRATLKKKPVFKAMPAPKRATLKKKPVFKAMPAPKRATLKKKPVFKAKPAPKRAALKKKPVFKAMPRHKKSTVKKSVLKK